MRALKSVLDLFGSVLPAAFLAVVLLAVSGDVFARLFLADSIRVSHDLAIVALAFLVWFGIVGTALNHQLFGVQFFVDRLPRRLRKGATALTHLAIIAISFEVLRAAIAQVQTARFTKFVALGWPKWIVSAGLALALGLVIVIQLIQLYQLLRKPSGTPSTDGDAQ